MGQLLRHADLDTTLKGGEPATLLLLYSSLPQVRGSFPWRAKFAVTSSPDARVRAEVI